MIESENQQPELKKKILTPKQKKQNNFQLGSLGEELACQYLVTKNYKILDRNIRVKNNEIDVIALDQQNNELVFIEIKTRSNTTFGNPDLAVTNKKLQSMALVAKWYMKLNHYYLDFRFDIIAIHYLKDDAKKLNPQIEHFENISWP